MGYETKRLNIYGEPGGAETVETVDLVEANWNVKRKEAGLKGHRVHINRITGIPIETAGRRIWYSYAFDGDFPVRGLDGSVINWAEAEKIQGDALHVLTVSGRLVFSVAKKEALALYGLGAIIDEIQKRVGAAVAIGLASSNG